MGKRLKLPTLLIVSESSSIRYWIRQQLDKRFFIVEAKNEKEAKNQVIHSHFDAIFVDDAMEESPSLELCRDLRTFLHASNTPILLITGRLKKAYLDKAIRFGVSDFLSVPCDEEELEMRLAVMQKAERLRDKTGKVSSQLYKKNP